MENHYTIKELLEVKVHNDNSKSAFDFYYNLWRPLWIKYSSSPLLDKDGINVEYESGFYVNFTGDCINSFNTVLGDLRKKSWGNFDVKRQDFKKTSHVLANFMPLPVVTYGTMIKSINQFKGTCGLGDFMDMFLILVKGYYDGKNKGLGDWADEIPQEMFSIEDPSLFVEWKKGVAIIFNANEKCYYNKFKGFKDYCDANFLNCYLKEGTEEINFFTGTINENHRIFCHRPNYTAKAKENDSYVRWAECYVDWADNIIKKRAEEIFCSQANKK